MRDKFVVSKTKNPPEVHPKLGGADTSEGLNATKHPERVARLSDCKKRSLSMGRYIQASAGHSLAEGERLTNLAADVLSCANYLVFHNYYTIDQIRLAKIMTCKKHLVCPVCARIRAAKQVGRYLERLQILKDSGEKINLAFLTLTVKNGPDLKERFTHLVESFKKYQARRRDYFKKGRGFNELCKTDGAVFSYEITNKGNEWHPHLHAIVNLTDFISVTTLSDEWFAITGDSYIVDIRKIKGDPAEGFLEVFKYALKFSELTLENNLEAFLTLSGKRMQGSYGIFHGVKVPETMTDELIDDLPYLEMFYKYSREKRAYNLENCVEKISKNNSELSE